MIDAMWYESNVLGHSTDKIYITQYTIDYLYDNDMNDYDIIKILSTFKKESIKYCDLPNSLWNDSLLKRDTYYFNSKLQILSKPPTLLIDANITPKDIKFFKEMKISFTKDDLLRFFYSKSNSLIVKDYNRDIGAIDYLLNRYNNQLMESVDICLYLIDEYSHCVSSLLNLTNYEVDILDKVNTIYYDNYRSGTNRIIYRWS